MSSIKKFTETQKKIKTIIEESQLNFIGRLGVVVLVLSIVAALPYVMSLLSPGWFYEQSVISSLGILLFLYGLFYGVGFFIFVLGIRMFSKLTDLFIFDFIPWMFPSVSDFFTHSDWVDEINCLFYPNYFSSDLLNETMKESLLLNVPWLLYRKAFTNWKTLWKEEQLKLDPDYKQALEELG